MSKRPIRIDGLTVAEFKKIEEGRMFSIQTTLPEPPSVGQQIFLSCTPDPTEPHHILTYRSKVKTFISFDTIIASSDFYDIEWTVR